MDLLAQVHASSGLFETLTQAAIQVPALVVLCLVVYVFLNHIKASQDYQAEREKSYEARQIERDKHLERLNETCHSFQQSLATDYKAFHRDLAETTAEAMLECRSVIKEATVVMIGVKNELARK